MTTAETRLSRLMDDPTSTLEEDMEAHRAVCHERTVAARVAAVTASPDAANRAAQVSFWKMERECDIVSCRWVRAIECEAMLAVLGVSTNAECGAVTL